MNSKAQMNFCVESQTSVSSHTSLPTRAAEAVVDIRPTSSKPPKAVLEDSNEIVDWNHYNSIRTQNEALAKDSEPCSFCYSSEDNMTSGYHFKDGSCALSDNPNVERFASSLQTTRESDPLVQNVYTSTGESPCISIVTGGDSTKNTAFSHGYNSSESSTNPSSKQDNNPLLPKMFEGTSWTPLLQSRYNKNIDDGKNITERTADTHLMNETNSSLTTEIDTGASSFLMGEYDHRSKIKLEREDTISSNLALREMFQAEEDGVVSSPKDSEYNPKRNNNDDFDVMNQVEYFEQNSKPNMLLQDGHKPSSQSISNATNRYESASTAEVIRQSQHLTLTKNVGRLGTPPSSLCYQDNDFLQPDQLIRLDSDPVPEPPLNSMLSVTSNSDGSVAESFLGKPVLYSAIGSLEDPSSSSYSGWRARAEKLKFIKKYDFHSSNLYLLPQNKYKNTAFDDATTPAISNQRKKHPSDDSSDQVKAHMLRVQVNGPIHPIDELKAKNATGTTSLPGGIAGNDDMEANKSVQTKKTRSNLKNSNTQSDVSSVVDSNHHVDDIIETNKKVTIQAEPKIRKSKKKHQKVVEMFRPSSDAYTPRMGKKEIKYKPAEMRTSVQQMASPLGTLSRPNFRDALRRVSMIIQQHIVKIERRFERNSQKMQMLQQQYDASSTANSETSQVPGGLKAMTSSQFDSLNNNGDRVTSASNKMNGNVTQKYPTSKPHHHQRAKENDCLFHLAMKDEFSEDQFLTPRYKCTMVRVPMARMGMVYGLKPIRVKYEIPTEGEIYEFAHQLFKKVQLSSECSIVCLIYVERLMEVSKVPLLASTWRPIFMCGLLLASKVWQDLSSWNIEFACVYPQYSLDAINRLELLFLRSIKWELYISSSLYAKYYFALRSLVEKPDFRQRYNRLVGGVNSVKASTARKIEERSTIIKEEVLQQLSRSM